MSNSIYCFQGLQEVLIDEKFPSSKINEIQLFVWKSDSGVLGFDTDELSLRFVKEFIGDKITVAFPMLTLIDNKAFLKKSIGNLQGITFLNNDRLIKEEFGDYLTYERKKERNALLARYGKVTETLKMPGIVNWYNSKHNNYTAQFMEFWSEHNLEFIVWAFSDFGIYFFSFKNIDTDVEFLAKQLAVNFIRENNILNMPYH